MNCPAQRDKKTFVSAYRIEINWKGAIMDFVETVKIDDPRLDEIFSFLFAFRKGDLVVSRESPALRGKVNDGVYVGEFPARAAGTLNPKGKTLYEIQLSDEALQIVDEKEIEKAPA
jgi:hypothetical protein